MRLKTLALLGAVFVSGCTMAAGTVTDKHLGMVLEHSESFPLKNGLLYNLNGFAGHSNRKGFNLALEYSATGIGWAMFSEAWSYGRQFEYVVTDRRVAMCGSGGCTIVESGGIRMTEDDFRKAALTGFDFKLVGQRGSIEVTMPAKAFQQVLERLDKAKSPAT